MVEEEVEEDDGEDDGARLLKVNAESRNDVGRMLLSQRDERLHAAAANTFFLVGNA